MRKKMLPFIPAALLMLLLIAQPSYATVSLRAVPPQSAVTATLPVTWTLVNADTTGDWLHYASASYIHDILPDGNDIWATTGGGLLRWNRVDHSVRQYLPPQVPLPGTSLHGLLLHAGQLYISGDDGVAIFDRSDNWTTYRTKDIGFEQKTGPDDVLGGVEFGPMVMVNNELWVGTNQGVAHLMASGRWEIFKPDNPDLLQHYVDRLEERPDGLYVFSSNGGVVGERETMVARLAKGRWTNVDEKVPDYGVAPDGSWWKSKVDGVSKSDNQGKTWRTVYQGGIWPKPAFFDAAGKVYLSNDDAVIVMQNDQVVETYRFSDTGVILEFINLVETDNEGRLWFGTDGLGLTMFDGKRWRNWQPENSPVREDAIRGMDVAAGKVYLGLFGCAGCGGVAIYDVAKDQWTNLFPEDSELSGGGVGGVTLSPQGKLYLPTSEGTLDIYDNGSWKHIKMTPYQSGYLIDSSDGLFDQAGNFWIATDAGLWGYNGEDWARQLQGSGVTDLALDRDGRMWAATSDGLAVKDLDKKWYFYSSLNGYAPELDRVERLKIDKAGRIWAVGLTGVVIFNGQEWQSISPEVVDETYWGGDLAFDAQGRAWIATSQGVARFSGQPTIGPFTSLLDRPDKANTPQAPNVSPWSFLTQGLCLLVFAPGAVAFERVYRKSRNKRVSS